jgi:hypothetical protein
MVTPASSREFPDEFDREPFRHHALANVDKLNIRQPQHVASKENLRKLAMDVGLLEVIRWKPRMVCFMPPQGQPRTHIAKDIGRISDMTLSCEFSPKTSNHLA